MGSLPAAIIFVNNDITTFVRDTLVAQLYIHEVMTHTEFNARMVVDPNYATIVRLTGKRILVTADFSNYTNRTVSDVAIFIKNGLACVEENKFGPPGLSLPVDKLYIQRLLNNN